uniref:Unique cartilage matrix-associated protein n=2 Tax=Cynoglossus semilaevis TaxID=244447 RepID=A0A3P8WHJ6_CYNSE
MSCTPVSLLAVLSLLFVLSLSPEAESAAVAGRKSNAEGPLRRVFMKEADASNFFRKRTRRNLKSQDEIDAEQRMVLAADNRKREFQEEKGNEFEDFDEEEEDDEESETTTQNTEQWGELSYEGTDPPQDNDGHAA